VTGRAAVASTIEERLARIEERLDEVEAALTRVPRPRIGVTIEEARIELGKPVERGPEQYAKLQRIIGCFEGPGDLSENLRDYLYGERE
jgi:hypothetical protein